MSNQLTEAAHIESGGILLDGVNLRQIASKGAGTLFIQGLGLGGIGEPIQIMRIHFSFFKFSEHEELLRLAH